MAACLRLIYKIVLQTHDSSGVLTEKNLKEAWQNTYLSGFFLLILLVTFWIIFHTALVDSIY